jgi:hypothetical protein
MLKLRTEKKENKMKKERDIVICTCYSIEHQLVISYGEDIIDGVEHPEVYLHIHLNKRSFWSRVRYSIKYIFGYQCRYGAFDEMIIDKQDVDKFRKIVDHLESLS